MTQQQLLEQSEVLSPSINPLQPIDAALNRIFIPSAEETRMQQARRIMGESITSLASEDLEVYLTEFQFLLDEWLNAYEKQVFEGMTLKQVLGQE